MYQPSRRKKCAYLSGGEAASGEEFQGRVQEPFAGVAQFGMTSGHQRDDLLISGRAMVAPVTRWAGRADGAAHWRRARPAPPA